MKNLVKKLINFKTYVLTSIGIMSIQMANITYAAEGTNQLGDLVMNVMKVVYAGVALLGGGLLIAGIKSVVTGTQRGEAQEKSSGLGMIVAGAVLATLYFTTGWIWTSIIGMIPQ